MWVNKTRTLLTILTIAVGVFALGFASSLGALAMQDMEADYGSANAHSAFIFCAPFGDDLFPGLLQSAGMADGSTGPAAMSPPRQWSGEPDQAYDLCTTTSPHEDAVSQARAVKANFRQAGIPISQVITGTEWNRQQKSQLDLIIYFLLVMALLTGLVGSLGLVGTLSMNVIERIREIGVMRAIGASNGAIFRIVVVEGVAIGLASWVLAVLLSVPITFVLNAGVGSALLSIPLDFYFGWNGVALWLAGALASFLLAWNAVRLTAREALAYE